MEQCYCVVVTPAEQLRSIDTCALGACLVPATPAASPSAMAAPAVPVPAVMISAAIAMLIEAEVQRNGRSGIGLIAVSGIVGVVTGVGRCVHGAAAEAAGQQQCGDDPPGCAFASGFPVSVLLDCGLIPV